MKITYINHSGFLVEMEEATLLFDYWTGTIPIIRPNLPLLVFASHSHSDHYNRAIWDLCKHRDDVVYVLSSDINGGMAWGLNRKVDADGGNQLYKVSPGEERKIPLKKGEAQVRTLCSTDMGVAFIVELGGKTIYHAGDLHWWSWEGESDRGNADMERRFKNEIKKIGGMKFDVAFLPLDLRLESRFWWGLDYFMRATDTSLAVPMHFWGDFSVVGKLRALKESEPYRDRVCEVDKEGWTKSV